MLNVVVMVKTNLTTGKSATALLFSDDLDWAYDKLIDYSRSRFQIEFNFRDAKHYWGLEDFMNVKETQVSNAANLTLFMVTFSQLLLPHIAADSRPEQREHAGLEKGLQGTEIHASDY